MLCKALLLFVLIISAMLASSKEQFYAEKHLVLITSKQHDILKKILMTIDSVRDKIPNPTVVVIDSSGMITQREKALLHDAGCDYVYDKQESFMNDELFQKTRRDYVTLNKISATHTFVKEYDFNYFPLDTVVFESDLSYYRIPMVALEAYKAALMDVRKVSGFKKVEVDVVTKI